MRCKLGNPATANIDMSATILLIGENNPHFLSGGGIAKFAPNRQAALQYLEYLASSEAQRIFAGSNFEYPVVSGVQMNAVLTGYGKFKADPLNPRVFGQKNAIALKVMDRSGWT